MKEIHVSNVPYAATEQHLKDFLESVTAPGAVCFCELRRDSFNTSHKGFGFVTFVCEEVADQVRFLATCPYQLRFQGRSLRINASKRPIKQSPVHSTVGLEGNSLKMGCLTHDTFHVLWSTSQTVETEFDFRERKLHMKLKLYDESASRTTAYRLEFRFRGIFCTYSAKIVGSSSRGPILLFELWYPPHVYQEEGASDLDRVADVFELLHISAVSLQRPPKQTWARTVDFTPNSSIGQSFAYLLEFPESVSKEDLSKVLRNLEDFRLASENIRRLQLKTGHPYVETSPDVLVPLLKCPDSISLSFKLMFQLNQLVQVGHLSGPSLSVRFFRLLSQTPEEQALWVIQNLLSTETVLGNPEQWLEVELNRIRTGGVRLPTSTSINLQDGSIWVYRLMVSPTKIYCVGPEAEISNRVTRQYIAVIDNFIRVSFIEEDGSTLSSQVLSSSEDRNGESKVYKRILGVLKRGIWLQGKHYEFLAFSSSQLREQSVWMFARTNTLSANMIRGWMGSFLDIRNVAKCAARMGQCFSSTTKTLPVDWWEVEYIEDIKTADGKYCFSDGIGKISFPFANRVARKCGRYGLVPSAFQIRYGGIKGVVAVNHSTLQKLSIRNSMKKFESEHFELEVISWTKRLPCYLNRQIITLLSTLGIEDRVFERMQGLVLSKLNEVLTNSYVALDILQMTSSGATHQITMEMLKAGYSPMAEPYLLSLLQAFRAFQLLQLRTKSRILVSKGRTMMGCLDETRILAYGQVFLRVSSFPGTRSFMDDGLEYEDDGTCVLTGLVVVAKNPCLHPGDVRVLQALDVPELHHMVDCVVFPQRGERPHPNECSGSDLDGDLYFVTWDQQLIPLQTDDPMDYTPVEPTVHPRPVSIEDIQEFFVQYMKSDSLGLIANAHVVHADKEPDMARNPKCLELANLFTVAVDFPKTGRPAVMNADLRVAGSSYPDFMEKDDKMSYESPRVLGKLFRAVVGEARETTLVSTFTSNDVVRFFDRELVWHGFEYYTREAAMLKSWYDAKLVGLMNQYDIKTEAEALSGNILPLSKFYVKRQGEVKDRISLAVRSLQSEARRWFKHGYEEANDPNQEDSNPALLEEHEAFAKASAWYHVTYHRRYMTMPENIAGGENYRHLLSFPWVVHDTLLAVKRRNRGQYALQ